MRDLLKETGTADGTCMDSTNRSNFYTEKIQMHEISEVVTVLTDAFETNPAYASIFNQTELREGLTWLFGAVLFLLNRRQTLTNVVKEKDSGKIVGTFTLVPPGGAKRTFGRSTVHSRIIQPATQRTHPVAYFSRRITSRIDPEQQGDQFIP
ncbi:MAG: hypothetical protein LBR86_04440 [Tannerella sp.]|jgi:hypothetical protein|nr:hypothetical protein [Tannerella sp.]